MGTLGFSPHLRVERVPGEAVYLVSERGVTALHGQTAETLAPLLDGSRDLEHILAEAGVRTDPADVRTDPAAAAALVTRVIARLCEAGLVCERGRYPRPEDAYW
ncbi:hypothetical protein AB4212_24560, partial [Streptomyces sp. 2MCAF27]